MTRRASLLPGHLPDLPGDSLGASDLTSAQPQLGQQPPHVLPGGRGLELHGRQRDDGKLTSLPSIPNIEVERVAKTKA